MSNETLLRISLTKSQICGLIAGICVFVSGIAYNASAQPPKGIVVEKVETPANLHLSLNIDGHTASIKALAFSPDSQTLYSAGMDKVVHAWRYNDGRAKAFVVEPVGWHKSHTIRWEIARSTRGSIYGLAVAPGGGSVAIAGYGARGTVGDIVFADATEGEIESVARGGHENSVFGLDYSPDGRWLVSTDLLGKSILWDVTREHLRGQTLQNDIRVGSSCSEVFAGSSHVLTRRFKAIAKGGGREMPTFGIDYYNINTGKSDGWAPITLYSNVSALAASRDGKFIAVGDDARRLYVYKIGDRTATKLSEGHHVARSLCLTPDGSYLAVGTMAEGGRKPQIQLWDTRTKKLLFAKDLERSVISVALSHDGRWLACNGGESHHIFTWKFDKRTGTVARNVTLAGGDRIVSVVPSPRAGNFQTRIDTNAGQQWQFDPAAIGGDPLVMIPRARAMAVEPVVRGAWTLQPVDGPYRLQLYQGRAARGFIQLDVLSQGGMATADSYCIVPDEKGRPFAVAVGTDTSNEVFVYNLAAFGECELLRRFRGHVSDVMALSITADRRFLVSGSADGTVRYWELDGITGEKLFRRWGTEFEIAKAGLKVTRCVDSSPLFHKGVRAGDIITQIIWPTTDGLVGTAKPATMLDTLRDQPWSIQFGMDVRRGDKVLDRFNLVPGWQHLLAVYVYNGEWIAWHPSGYYACSPGGAKLIGWQINKEIGETPRLFPAVQFHKSLYRPKEVSNLLAAGGLEKPEVAVSAPPSPPQVELTSPVPNKIAHDKPRIVIRARARPTGQEPVVAMQLYIDDRPGEILTFDAADGADDEGWIEGEWAVDLESSTYKFKVRADTRSCCEFSAMKTVAFKPEAAKRTLHLLTIAVNDYDQVKDLQYCVYDAQRIAEVFAKRGGLFDDVRVTAIHNKMATKPNIEAAFDAIVAKAGKDDLVLLFYSGHGYQHDGRFYMVTQNAEVPKGNDNDQVMLDRLCVSEDRIKEFCKGVARKTCSMMIMLDACHSGAANPVDFKDLSIELGTSDFNAVMMASSKGDQFSWEHKQFGKKHGEKVGDPDPEQDVPGGGAFTQALWWGLYHQEANYKPNKLIETRELSQYLEFEIPQLVDKVALGGVTQTPITNCFGLTDIPLILLTE